MRSVILSVLFATLFIASSTSAATQANPSQKERDLVEQMMQVTHADSMTKQMIDAMFGQMQKSMLDGVGNNDAAASEEARIRFERFRQLVQEKIDFNDVMRDVYTKVYLKYFSDDELAQNVSFYKSPVGQKMISVMPQIMADAMKVGADEIGPLFTPLFEQVENEREKAKPWVRTMSDMRMIATAVEAYSVDHEVYPRVSDWSALRKELEPTYVKELPARDVWGNAYSYSVSPDGLHYRIVSAGADGVFEWDSRQPAAVAKGAKMRVSDHLEDDIIYGDGEFLQVPKASERPARE